MYTWVGGNKRKYRKAFPECYERGTLPRGPCSGPTNCGFEATWPHRPAAENHVAGGWAGQVVAPRTLTPTQESRAGWLRPDRWAGRMLMVWSS